MKNLFKRAASLFFAALLPVAAFVSCADMRYGSESDAAEAPITAPNIYGDTEPQTSSEPESESNVQTSPETPASAKQEDTVIKFLAAGDNIIHSNVYEDALDRGGGETYEFTSMYDGIADFIAAADLAYVNQEGPMAGADYGYSGYPNFNGPQEMGDTLCALGFNIVNIANNHMLDKWESGLLSSIAYWETKDALLLGAFKNQQDYDTVRVLEYDGIKIAFLAYTYGTNGMSVAADSETVIPLFDDETIKRQVELAKTVGDLVFVSAHWGTEDRFMPDSTQEHYASLFVSCGVDVVIGMHPHVVEPLEWVEGENGHKTLVIYSLGNLISTMLYSRNMVGGIVTFDIVRKSGELSVENVLFNPTVCHYNTSRRGLQVYMMQDYTDELCSQHGAQKYGAFGLDELKAYITDTIDADFLPDYLK